MLFSIIVPVYNVGPNLLKTCLQSLFDQDIDKSSYEVIVVNDGTKDDSMEGAKAFANFSNLWIINQKNQGLGYARNTGIRAAKGDYIIFIDSDDFISSKVFLSSLKKVIDHQQYDVIAYGTRTCNFEGTKFTADHKYSNELFSKKKACSIIGHLSLNSAWCKTMRKDFILENDLFFPKGYCEDILWTYRAFSRMKSFNYCDIPFYAYRQGRSESITANKNIKFTTIYLDIIDEMLEFRDENNIVQKEARYYLDNTIYTVFCISAKNGIWNERLKKLRKEFAFILGWKRPSFGILLKTFGGKFTYSTMKFLYKLMK